MPIPDLTIHVVHSFQPTESVAQRLADLTTRIEALEAQEKATTMDVTTLTQKLTSENTALLAEVTRATTVEQSVETLLNGQSAQLAALKQQIASSASSAGIDDATVQPLLDSIDAQITANNALLDKAAAAVVANTPAQAGS